MTMFPDVALAPYDRIGSHPYPSASLEHRVTITLANPIYRSVVRVDGTRVWVVGALTIAADANRPVLDVTAHVSDFFTDLPVELNVWYRGHVDGINARIKFTHPPKENRRA